MTNFWSPIGRRTACALVVGAGLAAGGAVAQVVPSTPQTAPPSSQTPERTSATYGDWDLRCERAGEGAASRRFCEVAQTMNAKDTQRAVAEIAIGRPAKGAALRLTLLLPPSIFILAAPSISLGDKDPSPVVLQWQRCLPRACIALVELKDDVLARLHSRTEPGRIAFQDGTQRPIAFSLSFRGLAQALDALPNE